MRCEVRFQGILQNLANSTIREKIPTKKRPEGLFEIVSELSILDKRNQLAVEHPSLAVFLAQEAVRFWAVRHFHLLRVIIDLFTHIVSHRSKK